MRFPIALLLCSTAVPAAAELTFCNETGVRASVSIGYVENKVWTSEGWWGVEPYDCTVVVGGDLNKRYYYWRATNTHGAFVSEKYMFCTDSSAYTIKGDENCKARGYRREGFREEDTGEARSYSVALTEADAPAGTVGGATHSGDASPKSAGPAGPGTYGEPYSITANFQGCWASNEVLECEFAADGWTYVASENDPTDFDIIEALNAANTGTLWEISGDLISYSGETAQVTIREYAMVGDLPPPVMPSQDNAAIMDHIQGYWDSDGDSSYYWIVQGNQLDEIYDGNLMRRSFLEIHPECAASDGQGPVIIAWPEVDEGDGPACYVVGELGPRSLQLLDAVEGVILNFSYSN